MKPRREIGLASVTAFLLMCALTLLAASSREYHLLHTYKYAAAPGGREYFDYLTGDPESRRVYLSHGTEVLVVNADTGALEGKVSGFKRCHGVAIDHSLGKGFVTDGDEGKIFSFDLKTFQTTGSANAAEDADGILYDPASKRVFSFNGDAHSATAVDPSNDKVVGTVDLGAKPEFAVADGKGTLYNNLVDANQVAVIDSRSLKVEERWPIAPAGHAAPIAIDREHRRLFVAGRDPQMMVVMNADTGKVIQSFPITGGADAARFDPKSGQIFVSTGEGWVHIFHEDSPDRYSEVGKIQTEYGAKTMEFDPKTDHVFVDTAEFAPAPAPTAERPHPRRTPTPGTFHLLVYGQ